MQAIPTETWTPGVYPVHEECEAHVERVPEGMEFDARGWLVVIG